MDNHFRTKGVSVNNIMLLVQQVQLLLDQGIQVQTFEKALYIIFITDVLDIHVQMMDNSFVGWMQRNHNILYKIIKRIKKRTPCILFN